MANFIDLFGEDYKEDFPNLMRMLKDIIETTNTNNWEGQQITHTFVSALLPEVIPHTMGVAPTKVLPLNYEDQQGTYIFISADSENVTLESSIIGLTLTFYLEK